ncbi:MAG: hypothetical protein M1480_16740 [Bacteroidetes bacterium]|nr:hypothetical protein [Bacteroidota bacterium]
MKKLLFIFLFIPISFFYCQTKLETDVDIAFQNAKKGIYWALSNIPEKKTKLENDLIVEDKLFASVKLDKEINGIKIVSVGFNNSNEVTIKIFKSYDSLVKEGYLKNLKKADKNFLEEN